MSNYREPLDRAYFERVLADAKDILDSEYAANLEKDHAALEDLKAVCEELEQRLKTDDESSSRN